jgi:hypothetical protein
MVEFLRHRVPRRKLLLFAAAAVERLPLRRPDPRFQALAAATRGYATGQCKHEQFAAAFEPFQQRPGKGPRRLAHDYIQCALDFPSEYTVEMGVWPQDQELGDLLRCLAGNPFHPVKLDPGWLTANGQAVRHLAEAIERDQAFTSLPILADALEEAGCTEPALLAHCRTHRAHAGGCWALELLLHRPQERRSLKDTWEHLEAGGRAMPRAKNGRPRVLKKMAHPYDDRKAPLDYFRSGLDDADYSNLTLPRLFFGRSLIERVSYRNTDLSQSWMCWNDFIDCDFSGADLSGCEMRASIFNRCQFVGADLSKADLRRSTFEGCDFTGATLRGTRADHVYGDEYELEERLSDEQHGMMEWDEDPGPEPDGG